MIGGSQETSMTMMTMTMMTMTHGVDLPEGPPTYQPPVTLPTLSLHHSTIHASVERDSIQLIHRTRLRRNINTDNRAAVNWGQWNINPIRHHENVNGLSVAIHNCVSISHPVAIHNCVATYVQTCAIWSLSTCLPGGGNYHNSNQNFICANDMKYVSWRRTTSHQVSQHSESFKLNFLNQFTSQDSTPATLIVFSLSPVILDTLWLYAADPHPP